MAILNKGQTFSDGEQVTSAKLNTAVDGATFASGAVDDVSTQLSGGAIIVKDGGITTPKIANSGVTKGKIEDVANMKVLGNTSGSSAAPQEVSILDEDDMASDSSTSIPTQQSVKAFTGMTPVQNGLGGGYDGGESVTFPNGLIMKFGRVAATANGNYTVNFAESFNNAIISAMAITNVSTAESIDIQIVGTPTLGSMVFGIQNENNLTGFYWQAIGY